MIAKKSAVAAVATPTKPVKPVKTVASAKPGKTEKLEITAKAAKAAKAESKTAAAPGGVAVEVKRGRKPKEVEAKKPAPSEEDFSDIEADLEGEPEVETPAVAGDDAVKAKPLRMKVSRAKERALMREFGLEETALTEEEAAKRRHELKTLMKMGKTRGFLTHQEINDHLPEKLMDAEILEAIVSMLNDMGIAVYEQAPDAATLLIAGGGSAAAKKNGAECKTK